METEIKYDGKVITEIKAGQKYRLYCKGKEMRTDIIVTAGSSVSGKPIEVATEEEMTALLTAENIGKVYKYTGATGTYENGALYVVGLDYVTPNPV